jgi:hypothetical protein
MEYTITQLTAEIASGRVIEAHWAATLSEGGFFVRRYGSVVVPPPPETAALLYEGLDEGTAIEVVKDILGEAFIAEMEASMVAEMATMQAPTTISGLPWAPALAPVLPPPPAPPPAP